MNTLYIIAPAYNESENIDAFVDEWYPVIRRHEADGSSRLVVVDDGSSDGTYEKLVELAKTRPLLVLLSADHGGHGPAVIRGYEYALSNGADYIFQTDSDRQTTAAEFEEFIKGADEYAAIFGNRVKRGDGILRKAGEAMVRRMVKRYTGAEVADANAPYRLMNRSFLSECLKHIDKKSAVPNILITSYAAMNKEKLVFRNISFEKRHKGPRSLNLPGLFKLTLITVKELKRLGEDQKIIS